MQQQLDGRMRRGKGLRESGDTAAWSVGPRIEARVLPPAPTLPHTHFSHFVSPASPPHMPTPFLLLCSGNGKISLSRKAVMMQESGQGVEGLLSSSSGTVDREGGGGGRGRGRGMGMGMGGGRGGGGGGRRP